MAKGIQIKEIGGVEKLKYVDIPDKPLQAGEVRIRHTAIGVNYIDIYYRTGLYRTSLPNVLGVEGSGVIEAVGTNVTDYKVGDRVAYGTSTTLLGSYSTHRNMPTDSLVTIPPYVSDEIAAALILKGMTAHMLCRRVITPQQGWNILIHAAAGGVGTLLSQWAKSIGCNTIGTVGNAAKAKWAYDNGCTHVINYVEKPDFAMEVKNLTEGAGVCVVYDSVGKDTFTKSLQCLTPFGLMCSYGQSSGRIPPLDVLELSRGSLFTTRPVLGHYKSDRGELQLSAIELFEGVKQGHLNPKISHKVPLAEAAEAHRLLENRQTMGSIILIP